MSVPLAVTLFTSSRYTSIALANAILGLPEVTAGLYKLMDYAVDGVALGGWQLIDLALMGAIAVELLGLIFLKVVLILLGALLFT